MCLVVQKFGGSSVATVEKIRSVAAKVVEQRRAGKDVVVVVSAMGKTTDRLLDLARSLSSQPQPRELDLLLSSGERISSSLLAMAIQDQGEEAVALTGPQCGILTSGEHNQAKVVAVQPDRVRAELAQGRVVVVAGFQGRDEQDEVMTLGRGGSDTTAVALAAELEAEACQIFSDVAGVYSADPRVVESARLIGEIDYEGMHELARQGAQVLHTEAVLLAQRHGVAIQALPSFGEGEGTTICERDEQRDEAEAAVTAVAGRKDVLRISMPEMRANLPLRDRVLDAIDERNLLAAAPDPGADSLHLFVAGGDLANPETFAGRLEEEFGGSLVTTLGLGSVAAVCPPAHQGRRTLPQAARALFRPTSLVHGPVAAPRSISCFLPAERVDDGLRAFHKRFLEVPVLAAEAGAAEQAAAGQPGGAP